MQWREYGILTYSEVMSDCDEGVMVTGTCSSEMRETDKYLGSSSKLGWLNGFDEVMAKQVLLVDTILLKPGMEKELSKTATQVV